MYSIGASLVTICCESSDHAIAEEDPSPKDDYDGASLSEGENSQPGGEAPQMEQPAAVRRSRRVSQRPSHLADFVVTK